MAANEVVDELKKILLLCVGCGNNSVAKLSEWSTGLSSRFPGVNFDGYGVIALLFNCRASPDGGDAGAVVPTKSLPALEVYRRFEEVVRACSKHFGVSAEFLFEQPLVEGGEQGGEGSRFVHGDAVRSEPRFCDCCCAACIPVFSVLQLGSMVVVDEIVGFFRNDADGKSLVFVKSVAEADGDSDGE